MDTKKNILEEIKDTDNKIKKVFDDFIEQRKRTSQLLQTSYEQLKTSSFNHNNSKQSLNLSRDITLEGGRNDDSKYIKLTDYSPDLHLKADQMFTQENDDPMFTQEGNLNDNLHQNDNNRLNISQDTEDLLKSQDDLDIEFPSALRKFTAEQKQNYNNLNNDTQTINILNNNRRLSQNSLRTSMESLNDDSLLSSLHNNSIFNGSQFQFQQQQQQQNSNYGYSNHEQNKYSSSYMSGQSKQKKPLNSFLKVREQEIDFGKMLLLQEITKSVEILNSSDRCLNLTLFFETNQFELKNNFITVPEFSSAKVSIRCYKEDESRIFDTLCIQESDDNSNAEVVAATANDHLRLLVKAQIIKPQLIIKSDQNMFASNQFTTIEAKLNDLGEMNLFLTNPLVDLAYDIEVDVVQKQNDTTKITFFPQNLILKSQETKKVALTLSTNKSSSSQQNGNVFCVFFKINQSSVIFATKIVYS